MPTPVHKVNFRYTTVSKIREEGIDKTELPDVRARKLISSFSDRINRWTAQWFYPVKETVVVDGRNLAGIWRPDKMPILEVNSLTVDVLGSNPSQGTVVPAEDFEITTPPAFDAPGILIELRVTGGFVRFINSVRHIRFPSIGNFPRGPRNIEIIGSFGWISQKTKVSTTITAGLATDATQIAVGDTSKFNIGDAVRIGDSDPFVYFIVDTIDDAGKLLKFDDIGRIPATISSGAAVVTYGEVPEGIQEACQRLVIAFRHKKGSEEFRDALDASSLTGEKIGDYSYTKSQPKWRNASTTGIRDVDLILQDYVAANLPIFTR